MIKCLADVITDWLIRCEAVKNEDRELYIYAVYSICLSCTPLLLAVIIGLITGSIKQSILIIIPFVCIRKFSGGYHTNRAGTCLVESSLILISCIGLSFYIKCGWTLGIFTVLAAVSLFCFSPIDSANRELDQEEKEYCRKKAIGVVVFFLVIEILMLLWHLHTFVVCISIGIILSAGLQLPCVLKTGISKMTKRA